MALSKTILMQNIQRSANAVGMINTADLTTGSIGRDMAEALLLMCSACLANLASAFANGVEAAERISVTCYGQNEAQPITLAQCHAWCGEIENLVSECVYRFRIQQALLQANVWVSDLREPEGLSGEQAIFAAETGNILLQVVQDALAAGVHEGMTVEFNNARIPLAEVRNLGLFVANAGRESNGLSNADPSPCRKAVSIQP